MKTGKEKYLIIVILSYIFLGWGYNGHEIINRNTVLSFPPQMDTFLDWKNTLAEHGADADRRKSSDPSEGHKHYIDIDNYPEFLQTGRISQNFDSLIALHGYSFVSDQGILPWTILETIDSLQSAFSRRQFDRAVLLAADLGHYVGDAHMPLHLTRNYNGQFSNQYGVHGRYESDMMGMYKDQINYGGDSVKYVSGISDFIFTFIYNNYVYVDSILSADEQAAASAGSTSSSGYYSALWEYTDEFTIQLLSSASNKLAALIYTAWVNAGSPLPGTSIGPVLEMIPNSFDLAQNYPNPFNPSTTIGYTLAKPGFVTLKIFNILGREIAVIVNSQQPAGVYKIDWNAESLSGGIYFYTIRTEHFAKMKKMLLVK